MPRQPRLEELPKCSRLTFDSYTQAINFAEAHSTDSAEACQTSGHRTGWTKTENYAAAHKLASEGWKEGRKLVKAFRGRVEGLISSAHAARQTITHEVVGNGGIDMGRFMTGEPEVFFEWQDTTEVSNTIGRKVVTLWTNGSVSAYIESDVIVRRGAVLLSLVDILEAYGYSVDIFECSRAGVSSWGGDGNRYELLIPIKTAGLSMQEDQIAFACAHPSWLRRIQFSIIKQCGKNGAEAARDAYGVPEDYEPEDLELNKVDIYMPKMHAYEAQWSSDDAAIRWLAAQVKQYGVDLDISKVGIKA